MTCARCLADPSPSGPGWTSAPRRCAFEDGAFSDTNWNCGTIDALMNAAGDWMQEITGNDESMQVIPAYEECEGNGWIVLTRYKHRGKTSSAVYMGDFHPAEALTLSRAERTITGIEEMRAYIERRDAPRPIRDDR